MVINYKVDPSKVSIPSSVLYCGITMNKRWLYSLYICLSKELSISGSDLGQGLFISLTLDLPQPLLPSLPSSPDYLTTTTFQPENNIKQTRTSFIFKNIQSSPPCRKVDLDSSVKVSQDLQIIHLIKS